ncbi:M43 family zinc metalloprotease [Colwellia piezophila]|uniref:M43 family zinc metalloprotease n=1 Tax=Colwellia piezophila TaxID=211668 RepID=UPI0012F7C261|nr:M43 family zinc metalloprotease [Colwellia piezophila]
MTFSQGVDNEIGVYYLISADDRNGQAASATNEQLQAGIEQLNKDFSILNISFVLLDKIYLTNDDVAGINDGSWDDDNEEQVRPFFRYGALNIVVADLDGKNGHAYWNYEATDTIEVEPEDLGTSTISHEFGHNLGLLHTYQSIDDGSITLLEGVNGWQYGDKVIDTAVDPGKRSYYNHCNYTASAVDNSGNTYHPDGFNIMGKGQNTCRNSFTAEQVKRMQRILLTDKFHLLNTFNSLNNPTCINTAIHTDQNLTEGFNYNEVAQLNSWRQDSYQDDFNWKYYNYTNSSSTGASSPQEGHTFLHIDASHELLSANDNINLISPCFTFTAASSAQLTFYYSMYGADIGSLTMEVTLDNGVSWQSLWHKSGQQHTSGSSWSLVTITLDEYITAPFQLRFSGQVIGGDKGDISLDNISVTASQLPVQEQVIDITIKEQLAVELDVSVYFEALLISATVDSEIAVSINNGEYAINCQADAYTTETLKLSDGDTLCLRHTSSVNYQEQVTTVLILAEQSFNFNSTTIVEPVVAPEPVALSEPVTIPETVTAPEPLTIPVPVTTPITVAITTPVPTPVPVAENTAETVEQQSSGGVIIWLLLLSSMLLTTRHRQSKLLRSV